ncbi:MAG: hypothetical protein AB9866_10940 [Syntrophobacteraceae bacterium]
MLAVCKIMLVVLLLMPVQSWAADVSVAWNPSPDASVTGYRLYYWVDGGEMQTIDAGFVTSFGPITLADNARVVMVATAYSIAAESDYSRKLIFTTWESGTVILNKLRSGDGTKNARLHVEE